MSRTDILERKEDILKWIEENQPKAFICRQLNCKPETLNSYLDKMCIEYDGNASRKGLDRGINEGYKPASEYLGTNKHITSHKLKIKLIRDGLKENKCELCGLTEWQGKPIPLELHHINGNHYDNNLNNLQILCPNCHAIQNGNSGANIPILKKEREEVHNYCIDCDKEISSDAIRCKSCAAKQKNVHKVEWPTREELKDLIRNKPFAQIAKQYGVSDKAISKWCKSMNLPYRKKDINSYSDEEWKLI